MDKPAETYYPIHDLLRNRWSPRAFSPRPIGHEKISSLFEAARWSPSCANHQPWTYLIVTPDEPEPFAKLLGILTERNQRWAASAPMLILALTRRVLEDGTVDLWARYDLGQSVAHLSVEAQALGLVVHQMAGFDAERARQEFSFADEYDPVTVVAVGYPGALEDLPEEFRERELAKRSRRPIEEFVFSGEWNRSYRGAATSPAGVGTGNRN